MKRRFDSDAEDSDGPPEEELAARRPPARRRAAAAGADAGGGSSSRGGGSDDGGGSDGSGSDDGSDAELEEAERALEERLADVPFEVLARLAGDGAGPSPAAARAAAAAAKARGSFHRESKNRPQELSSKRPVSRFREVIQVAKHPAKDPRFDATIGGAPFDRARFAARYGFLYDEVLPAERAAVKDALKKEKREGKRRELAAQLTRLQQQLADERARRKSEALGKEWKAQEKAAVAGGKAPFFLGRGAQRTRQLVSRYEELKSAGQLDKFMEKRRKKNAAKDHRLPGGAMSSPAGKRRAGPTMRARAAAAAAAGEAPGGDEAAPSPLPELPMPLVLHVLSFLPPALRAWAAKLVCKAARERFCGATDVSLRCPELPLAAVQEAWRAVQGDGWEQQSKLAKARAACIDMPAAPDDEPVWDSDEEEEEGWSSDEGENEEGEEGEHAA
ncbi:ribosomal RNA processing protein 36 [Scenedesmus sp. PABB004]|nr:ribosomal RNA processing protein 36 [Scenedesmus sp. PABB004]